MNPQQHLVAKALTYAGTLPLVATSCGRMLAWISTADTLHFATTYSAVIISFLAGIHWACYLFFRERCPRNLLFTSNLVALLAWLCLLVNNLPWQILLHILLFLYLLVLDFRLSEAGVLPAWFYLLRRNATAIVVLSLSIIILLELQGTTPVMGLM